MAEEFDTELTALFQQTPPSLGDERVFLLSVQDDIARDTRRLTWSLVLSFAVLAACLAVGALMLFTLPGTAAWIARADLWWSEAIRPSAVSLTVLGLAMGLAALAGLLNAQRAD